jgi:hypothetical protein
VGHEDRARAINHGDQRPRSPNGRDERERLADERDRVADERERLADERERLADERDRNADERAWLADHREHAANQRERLADERQALTDEWARPTHVPTDPTEPTVPTETPEQRRLKALGRSRNRLTSSSDTLDQSQALIRSANARANRDRAPKEGDVTEPDRDHP